MTFEDELHDDLHAAGDAIDVSATTGDAVSRQAASRLRRRRTVGGLGAFALVAGALGGTYLATSNDTNTVQVATEASADADANRDFSDDEAAAVPQFAETASGESSDFGPVGEPEPIDYGVLPIDWEVLDELKTPGMFNIRVDDGRFYAQSHSGWIWTSDDFIQWSPLTVPDAIAAVGGVGDLDINGWVNGFDVNGGVIAAVVEVWDQAHFEDLPAAVDESGLPLDQEIEPFPPADYDPCASYGEGSTASVVFSTDGGNSWTVAPIEQAAVPDGRFHSNSHAGQLATDGATLLLATEQYLDLNVDCILADNGIDLEALGASGGWGWDQNGVQVFAGFSGEDVDQADSDGDHTIDHERPFDESIVETYTWAELGLSDAELAATKAEGSGATRLIRISLDGSQTVVEFDRGSTGDLIAMNGEYLLSVYDEAGPSLLRSSDAGSTWVEVGTTGFARADQSRTFLIREDGSSNTAVSTDGARTWTDVGAPRGQWVESLALLGDTALAGGSRAHDFGEEVPYEGDLGAIEYEASAGVDGYTVSVKSDDLTTAITITDDATGLVIVDEVADIADLVDPDELNLAWMRVENGSVAFFAEDGTELVRFAEADLEAAFDEMDGDGVTTSSGSGDSSAVPPPIPIEPGYDGAYSYYDETLLSYRSADGVWISQPLAEIVPDAGWIQSIVAIDGVFYLLIQPTNFGPDVAELEDEASTQYYEPFPIVLIGHPQL